MLKLISTITHLLPIQKAFLRFHQNPHILYYHMVADKKHEYYYQNPVTIDDFRYQLEWLKKHNYKFVPLSEIRKNPHKKQVAITTDDGFAENYTTLAPILNEFNISATFFLINNCIDNNDLMWMNKLYVIENRIGSVQTKAQVYSILRDKKILSEDRRDLNRIYAAIPMKQKEEVVNELWGSNPLPSLSDFMDEYRPYMTTQQIEELLAAGFSIGGHTFSHPRCSELTPAELKHEVIDAMSHLKEKFKVPVDYFAYPFGSRPKKEEEEQLFRLSDSTTFMGTKNSDQLQRGDPLWERDKMEQPKLKSLFWFSIVPMVRKLLLKPFGIHK